MLKKIINSILLLTAGCIIGALITIEGLTSYIDKEGIKFYDVDESTTRYQMMVDVIEEKINNLQAVWDISNDIFYKESSYEDLSRQNKMIEVLKGQRVAATIDEAEVFYDAIPLNFQCLPEDNKKAYSVSGSIIEEMTDGKYKLAVSDDGEMFKIRSQSGKLIIEKNRQIQIVGRLMGYNENNIPLLRLIWIN